MREKIPRSYGYILVFLIFAIGAVLAGQYLLGTKNEPAGLRPPLEGKSGEVEGKDRRIQELGSQIAQMRKELEENSSKTAELQARLEQATQALSSTEQKLKKAMRPAATPQQPQGKVASKPVEPVAPSGWSRPAEPGSYEIIRSTSVFAEPSSFSRKVSAIDKGTRVTVVGSVGEWLEVRSKHGNPPGFIRRDDAMFVANRD